MSILVNQRRHLKVYPVTCAMPRKVCERSLHYVDVSELDISASLNQVQYLCNLRIL